MEQVARASSFSLVSIMSIKGNFFSIIVNYISEGSVSHINGVWPSFFLQTRKTQLALKLQGIKELIDQTATIGVERSGASIYIGSAPANE